MPASRSSNLASVTARHNSAPTAAGSRLASGSPVRQANSSARKAAAASVRIDDNGDQGRTAHYLRTAGESAAVLRIPGAAGRSPARSLSRMVVNAQTKAGIVNTVTTERPNRSLIVRSVSRRTGPGEKADNGPGSLRSSTNCTYRRNMAKAPISAVPNRSDHTFRPQGTGVATMRASVKAAGR